MKFVMALALFLLSLSSFAQSSIVSVDAFDLAYSGGLGFSNRQGKGANRNETQFRLNLNFAQNIDQYVGLMWKAQLNFNRQDVDWGKQDTFESAYGLGGGILYNFNSEDIKNSFMVGAMAGVERATYEYGAEDDQSGFNFWVQIEAGKRFDLGKYSAANISFAPTVSLNLKRYGGDIRDDYFRSGSDLRFNFLKFDILF
jgi:hypothetical protein